MSSRIEQIIQEIEEYVDSCKFQPLSTTKIVVNKEEIEEYLRELRLKTPDEIKRYQKIISNKDAILEDAQAKADSLIADAQAKAQELVTQHEIMQKAYAQANETIANANKQAQQILDEATMDANNIRLSAISYTDDMMANMEQILATAINESGEKSKIILHPFRAAMMSKTEQIRTGTAGIRCGDNRNRRNCRSRCFTGRSGRRVKASRPAGYRFHELFFLQYKYESRGECRRAFPLFVLYRTIHQKRQKSGKEGNGGASA